MTKWLVTYSHADGAIWHLVDFVGKKKGESRGIIDLLAVRKDHRHIRPGLKRGDLLEIVLIQVKGGRSPLPTKEDVLRLARVASLYRARAVVLAERRPGLKMKISVLEGQRWSVVKRERINEIFG